LGKRRKETILDEVEQIANMPITDGDIININQPETIKLPAIKKH
jgi:hypothetical protein